LTSDSFLLATRSAGKVRELRALFNASGRSILTLDDLGIEPSPAEEELESADSFEENALAKARFFASQTKRAVVADDSGLAVSALGGRPGVLSKRWSGRTDLAGEELDRANNEHLLRELSGVGDRRARYVCAAAFTDGLRELVVRGESEGRILEQPRGSGGFGYDPYFLSSELGKTFAEASMSEKEAVSHRGRAFHRLLAALAEEERRG
jgi:XTP/dITP diphosphohydrolase